MNTSDFWPELLSGYVLGDLSPAETTLVTEYLANHPEAQLELQQLQAALTLMPLALPADDPTPALKKRLLQAAQLSVVAPLQRRTLHWWKVGGVAFVVMAMAGLGWQNYRLNQELASAQQELRQQQAMFRQPNNRLFAIKGMNASQQSRGSLMLVPASSQAVLALQKVPPLPPGKVYRMWAYVEDQDQEIACADFRPDHQGHVSQYLSLDKWKNVTMVVVTIEPEQSLPEALGEAVMIGGDQV